jgi:hypothetical protein
MNFPKTPFFVHYDWALRHSLDSAAFSGIFGYVILDSNATGTLVSQRKTISTAPGFAGIIRPHLPSSLVRASVLPSIRPCFSFGVQSTTSTRYCFHQGFQLPSCFPIVIVKLPSSAGETAEVNSCEGAVAEIEAVAVVGVHIA